jgi:hypothetical protein
VAARPEDEDSATVRTPPQTAEWAGAKSSKGRRELMIVIVASRYDKQAESTPCMPGDESND